MHSRRLILHQIRCMLLCPYQQEFWSMLCQTSSLIVWWPGGWTPNQSMYELFWWFLIDYTLKLLKPSGASLASLGILSSTTWCPTGRPAILQNYSTRLILNHDTIPYLKIKRNFIHTLFRGTPSFGDLATRLLVKGPCTCPLYFEDSTVSLRVKTINGKWMEAGP